MTILANLRSLLCCVIATSAPIAQCADYYLLKPIPSLRQSSTAAPLPPDINLRAGALPDATETKPYTFDFKTLTQLTGGAGIGAASYSLAAGALPAGLSLGSDGVLAGTPTGLTPSSGVDFAVLGEYGGATGHNTYTIKVGEIALEAVFISAGSGFTCAITPAGAAKCWGINTAGQLGNGLFTASPVPVNVTGLGEGVTAIATGAGGTTCAIQHGALKCWGANTNGQLGIGTTTSAPTPQQVVGMESAVVAVAVGSNSACAIKGGAVFCWGKNDTGQLGNGTNVNALTPTAVPGLSSNVTAIAGTTNHTCAVHSGAVRCWGGNSQGQIGDGTTTYSWVSTPTPAIGLESGVTAIAAGNLHTCAIQAGAAKCWGQGGNGELGDSTNTRSTIPVQVAQMASGVTTITAGGSTSCAVHSGVARCWGLGMNGQLGNGATTAIVGTPTPVLGLSSAPSHLSAGGSHTCAVASGSAKCWGSGLFGRLGNGATSGNVLAPAAVKP